MHGPQHTVIGHCQNRYLSNGTISSFYSASALVDSGQISVHITWISATTGYLFSCRRNFTESIAVGCQISKNDKNMFFKLIGIVFSCCECEPRCDNTFNPDDYQ